jgi:hypothetical protein
MLIDPLATYVVEAGIGGALGRSWRCHRGGPYVGDRSRIVHLGLVARVDHRRKCTVDLWVPVPTRLVRFAIVNVLPTFGYRL